MQLPTELVAAIHAGTGTHNLHTALALAHELVYSTSNGAIKRGNMLPVSGRVAGGVMLCALDMYTRAGRTAYRRVLSSAPRLMAMLHRYAPRGDPVECIGMLMFHAEGSLLSRRVESPASLAVQAEVEHAEAMSVGFESTRRRTQGPQVVAPPPAANRRHKSAGHPRCSDRLVGFMNAPTTKLTFNRRNLRDRDHGGGDVITNDNLHLSTVKMDHQIEALFIQSKQQKACRLWVQVTTRPYLKPSPTMSRRPRRTTRDGPTRTTFGCFLRGVACCRHRPSLSQHIWSPMRPCFPRHAEPTAGCHWASTYDPRSSESLSNRNREDHASWNLAGPWATAATSSTGDTRGRIVNVAAHDRHTGNP